jgi:putative endonuclease
MPLDLAPHPPARQRADRGMMSHRAGLSAEDAVARFYQGRGYAVAARRWRGLSGEIDLIFEAPDEVVFVEVKQAETHDLAAERLGPAQMRRIHGASDEYVDQVMGRPFIDRQFHLALVDGVGRIAILEDAFFVI